MREEEEQPASWGAGRAQTAQKRTGGTADPVLPGWCEVSPPGSPQAVAAAHPVSSDVYSGGSGLPIWRSDEAPI